MQDKAFHNEKIEFIWNTAVQEIVGTPEDGVNGVILRNLQTGEERTFPCSGVFVAIGHKPNTDLFKGWLDMDDVGYHQDFRPFDCDEYSRRLCLWRRAGLGLSTGCYRSRHRMHVGDRR